MQNSATMTPSTAEYDLEKMDRAYKRFIQSYPTYETTAVLDRLRATEYTRLDQTKQIYLDYTGGGMHAEKQLRQHMTLLGSHVFGNPHSNNPTSLAMTESGLKGRELISSTILMRRRRNIHLFSRRTPAGH